MPDRFFDLISLPRPVYLTMVHKTSTLAKVLWSPLYCTNLSTEVTTLETINSVAVTGYWCFMNYPCSIPCSTSTNYEGSLVLRNK